MVVNVTIDPAFARLLQRQREFQAALGLDRNDMTQPVMANYLRTQAFSLIAEVVEALDETHWKPWATPPPGVLGVVNRQRYVGELADVFIFTMNLMLAGNVSMMELAQAVDAKITKNIQRQADGYDGRSEKCPACKRAYDDAGVQCYAIKRAPSPDHEAAAVAFCENADAYVDAGGHLV